MSPEPKSADAALDRLLQGNARFAADRKLNQGHDTLRRHEVAAGQEPFAVVLGCSDSRVPVELIFDTGLGDLFVVRVAGNTAADPIVTGSVEFAITVLGCPLVLVLGHETCGAIAGAVAATSDGAAPPGAIGDVVAPISPLVAEIAEREPELERDELIERAVAANVGATMRDLVARSDAIADRVESGSLRVAGGVYRLESGEVELI